jgi:two-component system, LuxR family, sensor kinase FixL
MISPEVLRIALIKTGTELTQNVITQPHGANICPNLETVILAMPPGIAATACQDVWRQLNQKPFNLIIDDREKDPGNTDLRAIIGDGPLVSAKAAPVILQLLQQLENTCSTEEVQANIIDSAADAIVTINEDHVILSYNQGAEKIFGFSRQEVQGQDLSILIPPPHKEQHRDYVRRYMATRDPHVIGKHVQLKALRKNGEEFPISISFSVADIGGNLYFTGIVRDISEYVELEEKVRKNEQLAAIGNTVSQIVHEIKNPLMIIGGFAQQLLKAQTLDAKGLQKLAIITEEVSRLESLMVEMRDYSKPPDLKREIRRIETLLQEVVDFYLDILKEKGIDLILLPAEPLPAYNLDYPQLKQVLLNLVKNASEAMPTGGSITLAVTRRLPNLEIMVADTGEGMAPDVAENIFTPYFTTKSKGSGLGLAISRNIIRAHNGDISVESQPGKGSTFTIRLPLAEIESGACPI